MALRIPEAVRPTVRAAVVMGELQETDRPFLVIEHDEGRAEELRSRSPKEYSLVIGDATEDEVLHEAGIERARSLVSYISSNKDNLLLVLTARTLNPRRV
jgi:voltage-gated potassium channel